MTGTCNQVYFPHHSHLPGVYGGNGEPHLLRHDGEDDPRLRTILSRQLFPFHGLEENSL